MIITGTETAVSRCSASGVDPHNLDAVGLGALHIVWNVELVKSCMSCLIWWPTPITSTLLMQALGRYDAGCKTHL